LWEIVGAGLEPAPTGRGGTCGKYKEQVQYKNLIKNNEGIGIFQKIKLQSKHGHLVRRLLPISLFVLTAVVVAVTVVLLVGNRGKETDSSRENGKELIFADDRVPWDEYPWDKQNWFSDHDKLLVRVDRQKALSENDVPPDLVSLAAQGIATKPTGLSARLVIMSDFKALCAEGKKAGHDYYVFSAYRSFATQIQTYQYWVQTLGEKEANRSSAKAGHSEHQLGTTLDISASDFQGDVYADFGDSAAGIWLAANAHRFGFVMSYAKETEAVTGYMYEPWHFRYVGREVAATMTERGITPSVFIKELEELRKSKTVNKSS
jgi:D-alanyl-D-alanine carboxypeptidase